MEIDPGKQIDIDIPNDRLSDIVYEDLEGLLWSPKIKSLVEEVRLTFYRAENPYNFVDEAERLYLDSLELCNQDTEKIFLLIEINKNLYYQCKYSTKIFANCNLILELLDSIEGNSHIKSILRIYCLSQISLASELIGDITTMKRVNEEVIGLADNIPNLNPRFRSVAMNNLGAAYACLGIENDLLFKELINLRTATGSKSELLTATRTKINYLNSIGEFDQAIQLTEEILSDSENGLSEVAIWSIHGAKAIAYAGKAESDFNFHKTAIIHLEIVLSKFPNNRDKDTIQFKGRLYHALAKISEAEDAIKICKENQSLYRELGDKYHAGLAYLLEAQIHLKQGNTEEAQNLFFEAFKMFKGLLPVNSPYFRDVLIGVSTILDINEACALSCLAEQFAMEKRDELAKIDEECLDLTQNSTPNEALYKRIASMAKQYFGLDYLEIFHCGQKFKFSDDSRSLSKEQFKNSPIESYGDCSIQIRNNFWEDEIGGPTVSTAVFFSRANSEGNFEILTAKLDVADLSDPDYIQALKKFLKTIYLVISKNSNELFEVTEITRNLVASSIGLDSNSELLDVIALETSKARSYNALRALSERKGDRQAQIILVNKAYQYSLEGKFEEAQRLYTAACILGPEDPKKVLEYTNEKLRRYNTIPYEFLSQAMNQSDLVGYGKLVDPGTYNIGLWGAGSLREVYILEKLMTNRSRIYTALDREEGALFAGLSQMQLPGNKDLKKLIEFYGDRIAMEIFSRIMNKSDPQLLSRVLPIVGDFLEDCPEIIRSKIRAELKSNRYIIRNLFENIDCFDAIIFGMRTIMYIYGWRDIHTVFQYVNEMLVEGGYMIINLIDLEQKTDQSGRQNFYGLHEDVYKDRALKEGLLFTEGTFRDKTTGTRRSPTIEQLHHIARNTGFIFDQSDVLQSAYLPFIADDSEADRIASIKYLYDGGIMQYLLKGNEIMREKARLVMEKGAFRRDLYIKLRLVDKIRRSNLSFN